MNQADDLQVHEWLRQTGPDFEFPATPDVRGAVEERLRRRRPTRRMRLQPAWALLALLLFGALLMLVPQVRAAVLDVLRAGAITIFVTEPTSQVEVATDTPKAGSEQPEFLVAATPTSAEAAREALGQTVELFSHAEGWGTADQVYVDDGDAAQVAILVWQPDEATRFTLYAIAAADFADKQAGTVVATSVRGIDAVWVEGLHGFSLRGVDGVWDWQSAQGAVLIWQEGGLTYRLEGAASPEEARQFAESLR